MPTSTAFPAALRAVPSLPDEELPTAPARADSGTDSGTAFDADAEVRRAVPLVAHIVRETMGRVPDHVDRGDLNSAGLIALVTASRAFDPTLGIPFARYAATRIRGALMDELRSVDWASRAVRRRGREIEAARSGLATKLRRVPADIEVAEALGLDLAEIQRSDDDLARASVLSLDANVENPFAEVLPSREPGPEEQLEHRERLEYLDEAVTELPDRLRAVIQGYFIDERPMAELAEELGVSESRISQMRAEALVLLRGAINSALDPELVSPHGNPDGCAARRRDAYFRAVADRHAVRATRGPVVARALDTTA